ncbi:MAG: gliding motility-associated-like protein [Oceanospirillaceae bacterium]
MGSWTEIGTEPNVGVGSFIHSTGMLTNPISTGPNYYQVRTRSGCITNPVVEAALYPVSSIYLDIVNNGTSVDLNWTPVATPPLPSSTGTGTYQVYEEVPAGSGNWSLIHETTNLTYSFPVTVCEIDPRNYRVELGDNLVCASLSKEEETLLDNPSAPDPQPLDSVSVVLDPITGNELAVLGWQPNSSLNVTEYTIIQNDLDPDLPLFNVIDVVLGYNNTVYQNNTSIAGVQKECYRIRARNGCGTPGVQDPIDQMQCTMLLEVELEPCERTNHLSWTPYERWDEGIKEYQILMKKDGSPELKIAILEDNATTFTHENVQLQATYTYRVRAVRNVSRRITSTSNEASIFVFVSKIPEYHYAFSTTVPNDDKVIHNVFVDPSAGISSFEILRGQTPGTLGKVGTMEFDSISQFYEYSDFKAKPNIRAYYYATVALDACEEPMDSSNHTRTIFLETEAETNRINTLNWSPYEGWPDGVDYYNIYRNYKGSEYEYLATVPRTTLTYTDNVIDLIEGEGNFCYYLEAVETGPYLLGDPVYSFDETSTSNVSCAPQHPNIFVPNAFAPNGVNKVFLPISIYVDFESYVFTVYDRFGGKLLRTLSKTQGWDGTLGNGMEAAQGVYAYTIEYETASGIAGVQTGTVTLYR